MAFLEFKNVRIAGISTAVPKKAIDNIDCESKSSDYDSATFVESTGVRVRRVDSICTSDLGLAAAEKLISDLGWEKSEMRSYLNDTILPLIPSNVAERINAVKKISKAYDVNETDLQQTTYDKLWIPGHREIFNSTTYDKTGPVYSAIYKDSSSRIKSKVGGSADSWWLRSAGGAASFRRVVSSGGVDNGGANSSYGVCPGFCF